nr:MAG TPA: hypothetical protein [Bacteriophage sp.]
MDNLSNNYSKTLDIQVYVQYNANKELSIL